MVYNLVYSSDAQPGGGDITPVAMIEDILATSRRRNGAVDVTGALLFSEGRFVQVLEGEREAVHEIFERIKLDPRHRDVQTLSAQTSDRRRFKEWSMAFVGDNAALRERFADAPLAALGKRPSGDALLDFMLALARATDLDE